ncbi:MAG: phosphate ABC transporter permease subunit PstC [Nitrososphaerales archaeon]
MQHNDAQLSPNQKKKFVTTFFFLQHLKRSIKGDNLFIVVTAAASSSIIIIMALMIFKIYDGAAPVFERFGVNFLTGLEWNPVEGMEAYGALPYLLGTITTSAIALVVGVPISLGVAIFLAEIAPSSIRAPLSYIIELLAAVPSVIYGLWGVFVFRFWVRDLIEKPLSTYLGFVPIFSGTPYGLSILSGGLILSIMIIPTVSAVCREVLLSVPATQRDAAYSLGATRWEAIRIGVLSYARAGIIGAIILGLGRAVGETMAVTMVIGNAIGPSALPTSLLKAGQTMASIIANEFNEADPVSLHPSALIGVGFILLLSALLINVAAQILIYRVRMKGVVE